MSVTFSAMIGKGFDASFIGESANLANGNAAEVLGLLGYCTDAEPAELYGEDEPEKFLGRVLTARALLDAGTTDDIGTPDVVDSEPGRATVVHCGHRPGYLAEKLAELEDVATTATAGGGLVVWN